MFGAFSTSTFICAFNMFFYDLNKRRNWLSDDIDGTWESIYGSYHQHHVRISYHIHSCFAENTILEYFSYIVTIAITIVKSTK